jgi:hypothetical protein
MGVNDIGNSYYNIASWPALGNSILDVYFNNLKEIYDVGGRHFVLLNVPRKYIWLRQTPHEYPPWDACI